MDNHIEGYICKFNSLYKGSIPGYQITPEAFNGLNGKKVPVVFNNGRSDFPLSHEDVIGNATLDIQSDGVKISGSLLNKQEIDFIINSLKTEEFSFGFYATNVKYYTDENGIRYYTDGNIRSVSVLPYKYNPVESEKPGNDDKSGKDGGDGDDS